MANFVYPIPFPVPLSNPYDYPEVLVGKLALQTR